MNPFFFQNFCQKRSDIFIINPILVILRVWQFLQEKTRLQNRRLRVAVQEGEVPTGQGGGRRHEPWRCP